MSIVPKYLSNNTLAIDFALRRQLSDVFTFAFGSAMIFSALEFIHDHAREDIGLIVDVVKNVTIEHVEAIGGYHEAITAHPEAIGEGSCSK